MRCNQVGAMKHTDFPLATRDFDVLSDEAMRQRFHAGANAPSVPDHLGGKCSTWVSPVRPQYTARRPARLT